MVQLTGADPKPSQHTVWGKSSHRKKYLWTKNRWTDVRNWAMVRDGSGGGEVPNLYCEWVLGVRLLAFELPLRIEGGGVQKDRPRGAFIHLL